MLYCGVLVWFDSYLENCFADRSTLRYESYKETEKEDRIKDFSTSRYPVSTCSRCPPFYPELNIT